MEWQALKGQLKETRRVDDPKLQAAITANREKLDELPEANPTAVYKFCHCSATGFHDSMGRKLAQHEARISKFFRL